MFQQTVNRNYTSGFAGEVAHDGPLRAKPGRIASDGPNTISRAFGFSDDQPATGTTLAAFAPEVIVGGKNFYGVLVHPKHYALFGTAQGGPLAASYDLPKGTNAEFADMAILHAELFNAGTATSAITFGWSVAYVPSDISAADNPNKLPIGALVAFDPAGAAPAGLVVIPNARVINSLQLAGSSPTSQISGVTKIQLTQ
jgi:hypothetical protein